MTTSDITLMISPRNVGEPRPGDLSGTASSALSTPWTASPRPEFNGWPSIPMTAILPLPARRTGSDRSFLIEHSRRRWGSRLPSLRPRTIALCSTGFRPQRRLTPAASGRCWGGPRGRPRGPTTTAPLPAESTEGADQSSIGEFGRERSPVPGASAPLLRGALPSNAGQHDRPTRSMRGQRQQFGSSTARNASRASVRARWKTFIPRRSDSTMPALRSWPRW